MRILLVEDDLHLSETLAEALSNQRYVVDAFNCGEKAWEHVRHFSYDLAVLDVMLPDISGVVLCQRMRMHGYRLPILLLTARDTVQDKISGLDAGADDYVIKPVDLQELFARVRALLRRGMVSVSPILQWQKLSLDPSTFEVTYDGSAMHLTPKEFGLLEILMRSGRRVLSRSVLIEHAWPLESAPGEDTVKVHIRSLRQKLKAVCAPDDFIETVHSTGYRLKSFE